MEGRTDDKFSDRKLSQSTFPRFRYLLLEREARADVGSRELQEKKRTSFVVPNHRDK